MKTRAALLIMGISAFCSSAFRQEAATVPPLNPIFSIFGRMRTVTPIFRRLS